MDDKIFTMTLNMPMKYCVRKEDHGRAECGKSSIIERRKVEKNPRMIGSRTGLSRR